MKTNKIFGLAALVCGLTATLTSCDNQDNAVVADTAVTISFENRQLNADGFWIGSAEGTSYSYEDDWGGKTTTFTDNVYEEGNVKFPVTYSLYESAYGTSDFWSGVAISNRTETSFSLLTLTPDQFNNVTGKAHSGQNFAVITTYGETIDLGEGVVVKSLFYTNSAYTVNSIVKGDNFSGAPFTADDWLTCTLNVTKADGTTADVDIELAKDGTYVADWQLLDLSSLGKITKIGFTFTGSRSNDYGVLTPAYICIDDVTVEK